MTFAPSPRARRAVSRPMPALPPITTTVWPSSSGLSRIGDVVSVLMILASHACTNGISTTCISGISRRSSSGVQVRRLELAREVREAGSVVPILMLTARDAVQARIAGLDSGADDYLTKPFDFGELLARLRALIRRGARPPLPERLNLGALELDTRARTVTKRGAFLALTTREYALLEYLARHAGAVVGRAEHH